MKENKAKQKATYLYNKFGSLTYALMCVDELENQESEHLGWEGNNISYSSQYWWQVRAYLQIIETEK
jgi:hypothetical protein